jgi:hypothetical protein
MVLISPLYLLYISKMLTEIVVQYYCIIFIKILQHRGLSASITRKVKVLQWKVVYHWNKQIISGIWYVLIIQILKDNTFNGDPMLP